MLIKFASKVALLFAARWVYSKGQQWALKEAYGGAWRWCKGSLRTLDICQLDFRVVDIGESVHTAYGGSAERYFTALQAGQVSALPASVFAVAAGDAAVRFFYDPEQIRVEEVVRFIQTLDVELEIVLPLREKCPNS
ncbi:MAG: hypothetical protein ACI8P2_001936 [Candidatus Latescibacterota bacterium]|jgi:hypothetical protein